MANTDQFVISRCKIDAATPSDAGVDLLDDASDLLDKQSRPISRHPTNTMFVDDMALWDRELTTMFDDSLCQRHRLFDVQTIGVATRNKIRQFSFGEFVIDDVLDNDVHLRFAERTTLQFTLDELDGIRFSRRIKLDVITHL